MTSTIYSTTFDSPIGEITLAATDVAICGLYFEKHKPAPKRDGWRRDDGARFDAARRWLQAYFGGEKLPKKPAFAFESGTDFQRRVWAVLKTIPRGRTMTYAEIAREIGSVGAARAVGAAVGRNPLSILVPCHRVVGGGGSLTGFAGGLERKKWLLEHEGALAA